MTKNPQLFKKLAVLVSGSGSNLQAIIDAIKNSILKEVEIAIVISNKKDALALTRAQTAGIKSIFLNPKDFKNNTDYEKELIDLIKSYNVDLIVLAGYLRILGRNFVNAFLNKIINIHPALLPDFGGKGMYGEKVHEAVIKSGTKESGCTVHFVTSNIDAGPIIAQRKVSVLETDTPKSLAKRVLKEEHKLLIETIRKILFGVCV